MATKTRPTHIMLHAAKSCTSPPKYIFEDKLIRVQTIVNAVEAVATWGDGNVHTYVETGKDSGFHCYETPAQINALIRGEIESVDLVFDKRRVTVDRALSANGAVLTVRILDLRGELIDKIDGRPYDVEQESTRRLRMYNVASDEDRAADAQGKTRVTVHRAQLADSTYSAAFEAVGVVGAALLGTVTSNTEMGLESKITAKLNLKRWEEVTA